MPLELFFDLVTRSLIAFHTVAVSQFQQTATTAVPRAARSANATNLATMSLGCRWLHTACGWLCARACVAAAASSRYGKRLLTDPDDRLGDPLFGEPAADFGKEAQQPARASAAACSRGTSCRRFAGRCCSGRAPTARRAGPRSVHQVRRPASDISLMRDIHPRCPCRVPAKERQGSGAREQSPPAGRNE